MGFNVFIKGENKQYKQVGLTLCLPYVCLKKRKEMKSFVLWYWWQPKLV